MAWGLRRVKASKNAMTTFSGTEIRYVPTCTRHVMLVNDQELEIRVENFLGEVYRKVSLISLNCPETIHVVSL